MRDHVPTGVPAQLVRTIEEGIEKTGGENPFDYCNTPLADYAKQLAERLS
jgi:hypothetical protein